MYNLDKIIKRLREQEDFLRQKYSVSKLAIFGSYVRGEQKPDSDIDILAEFEQTPGLEFVDLAEDLERILGIPVDLVSRKAISDRLMKHINQDLRYV